MKILLNLLLSKLVSLRAKRSNLILKRLLRHFVPRNDTLLVYRNWSIKFFLIFAFCVLNFSFLTGCQKKNQLYQETQILMGTFVEVKSDNESALNTAFNEIKRVENLLSKYKPESEICRLNEAGSLKVSLETIGIINKAKEFWLASGGLFDITVGPLIDIWGFTEYLYKQPPEQEILDTLNKVGFEKISINSVDNLVEFKVPGMKIDLGAIAKGYAVDCAINKVKEIGVENCLINAGGDIYCLGNNYGSSWVVGIQSPDKKGICEKLELENKAVATSGVYEQSFNKGGRKYAHFLNPKTGWPVDSPVVSVTIIADDCVTADALATVISLLGKEKGAILIKNYPDVQAEVIENHVI
ncbi:MAG: FAD:protein FMN transferase [Candidatus Omnitrophota bacterium]